MLMPELWAMGLSSFVSSAWLCLASYFLRCLWTLWNTILVFTIWLGAAPVVPTLSNPLITFFSLDLVGHLWSSLVGHLGSFPSRMPVPIPLVPPPRWRSPLSGGLERCDSDGATCSAKWSLCLVLFLHCFLKRLLQRLTTKARSPDSLFVGCIHICRLWGCAHSEGINSWRIVHTWLPWTSCAWETSGTLQASHWLMVAHLPYHLCEFQGKLLQTWPGAQWELTSFSSPVQENWTWVCLKMQVWWLATGFLGTLFSDKLTSVTMISKLVPMPKYLLLWIFVPNIHGRTLKNNCNRR